MSIISRSPLLKDTNKSLSINSKRKNSILRHEYRDGGCCFLRGEGEEAIEGASGRGGWEVRALRCGGW